MSSSSQLLPPRVPHLIIAVVSLASLSVFPAVCGANSPDGPSNSDSKTCDGQSSCLAASSIIPLTFLVLTFLVLLMWCALHVCCDFPCCCCCGCRVPRCNCLRCFGSTTQQSQVHTHLHAEDVPLTHPVLASPADHLAPLVRPPPASPHYRPYKGNYRIGKNHHLQPFTLHLHFDYATNPRTLSGHGVDDGQSFTITDATFTVNSAGEHRCVFVERFGDGSRYVFYGVWDAGRGVEERWSGFWLRESGVLQQGTFSFQWDEAADEQMREARLAGETDVDGWMERRVREQLAARERRYIVLRGLEERKEATDGTAAATRWGGREEGGHEATAIEIMEMRFSRANHSCVGGCEVGRSDGGCNSGTRSEADRRLNAKQRT